MSTHNKMLPQCSVVHIQLLLQPNVLRQILATKISLPSWQKPNQTKQNSNELSPLIHKDVFHRSSRKVDQWQRKQLRYLIISCVINKGKHKKDHMIVVFKRSTIYAFYIVNEFTFVLLTWSLPPKCGRIWFDKKMTRYYDRESERRENIILTVKMPHDLAFAI